MKKLLTLTLMIALTFACLAGCGAKKDSIEVSKVVMEKPNEDLQKFQTSAATATNTYIVARMYLEEMLSYDIQNGNMDEYSKLVDQTVKAFEVAEKESNALMQIADTYIGQDLVSARIKNSDFSNPFVMQVYAAEDGMTAKEWAENITKMYDEAPYGKGIRTLAEQLNVDSKKAYAQLQQAQEILKSDAYNDFADYADACYKTAKVLKTAGTGAQLYLSVVTGGGATSTIANVMEKGGIVINGINTLCEVGSTSSILIVGDDNCVSQACDDFEDAVAPIGNIIGLYGITHADYAENLGANLTDAFSYVSGFYSDLFRDNKLFGGTFTNTKNGIEFTMFDKMLGLGKSEEEIKEAAKQCGFSDGVANEIAEKYITKDYTNDEAEDFEKYLEGYETYDPNVSEDYTDELLSIVETPNLVEEVIEESIDEKTEDVEIIDEVTDDADEIADEVVDAEETVDETEDIEETIDEAEEAEEEIIVDSDPDGIPTRDEMLGRYDYWGEDFNGDPLHYSTSTFTASGDGVHLNDPGLEGDFDLPYVNGTARVEEDGASATFTFWKENGVVKSKLVMNFGDLGSFTFYATKQ